MTLNTFLKYWSPAILWLGITVWLSSGTFSFDNTSTVIEPILRYFLPTISGAEVRLIHGLIRKLAHGIEYFVLGLLLFRALRGTIGDAKPVLLVLYSLIALSLFAGADEYRQSFDDTRTSSMIDVGIDMLGGFLGLCVIFFWYRSRRIDHA